MNHLEEFSLALAKGNMQPKASLPNAFSSLPTHLGILYVERFLAAQVPPPPLRTEATYGEACREVYGVADRALWWNVAKMSQFQGC